MAKTQSTGELIAITNGVRTTRWEPVLVEASGLAVVRSYKRGRFIITHVGSGLAVAGSYPSLVSAAIALGRLTMFLDWTGTRDEIQTLESHQIAAMAIRQRQIYAGVNGVAP